MENKISKIEEVVERYLNSKNEDFFNDFKSIAKVLTDNGITKGALVDKVVKHYWFKVNEHGGDFKTYAPSQDVKMVMSSIDILKQWVQSVDVEARNELYQLFTTMYNNASIIDKVSMWNQRERHKVSFSKAMQLRGEKVKKEDFIVDEPTSTKPFSEALSQIHTLGESMRKNVCEYLTSIDELNDNVYQFTESYTTQCMDIIKSMHGIQCDKQQVKKNYITEMINSTKYHLNIAYANIDAFVKRLNNDTQPQEQTPNITVIDGMEFMNDFK